MSRDVDLLWYGSTRGWKTTDGMRGTSGRRGELLKMRLRGIETKIEDEDEEGEIKWGEKCGRGKESQ